MWPESGQSFHCTAGKGFLILFSLDFPLSLCRYVTYTLLYIVCMYCMYITDYTSLDFPLSLCRSWGLVILPCAFFALTETQTGYFTLNLSSARCSTHVQHTLLLLVPHSTTATATSTLSSQLIQIALDHIETDWIDIVDGMHWNGTQEVMINYLNPHPDSPGHQWPCRSNSTMIEHTPGSS